MCRRTLVAAGLLLASCGTVWAGEVNTAIVNADRYLSVQVGGMTQNYSESIGDKEQGTIPSIGVEYSLLGLDRPFLFKIGLNYSEGNTRYKGFVQNLNTNTTTPSDTTTSNHIFDAYVGLGYAFGFGPIAVTPGVEYGEHSWRRDINFDTGPGYQENYGNQYVAVTLLGQLAVNQYTVISLSGAYGQTLNPSMTNNVFPSTYSLNTKPWTQLGFKVDYAAYSDMHIGFGINYTEFKYGASPTYYYTDSTGTTYASLEPFSKTQQTIVDLSLGYNF